MNGVAERINRTMFNSVRAMLAETGLPHRLWTELSLTFAYLKNRSPHSTLDFKVPYVKWKQQGLSLCHLKRPGAKCFVHHTAPGREKLEDRAWVGVLVGYAFGTRGYRVWDPATDRVEVESLQTADSSPVTERNWPRPLSDSSDDSSSTGSDDDSPAPIMTTPEKNLLLAPIPNASSIEDSQSQSGGRLTDALLYLTTTKPILKQSTGRQELDLPQSDNVEPDDHLSKDNGDFEDAESLPTNELNRQNHANFAYQTEPDPVPHVVEYVRPGPTSSIMVKKLVEIKFLQFLEILILDGKSEIARRDPGARLRPKVAAIPVDPKVGPKYASESSGNRLAVFLVPCLVPGSNFRISTQLVRTGHQKYRNKVKTKSAPNGALLRYDVENSR
uniref:Retroviral polymerase SH3-like domain-containing protein n=1 Tax=Strigamia maritima TaxID=126957 RepID=T1IMC8_STRMM